MKQCLYCGSLLMFGSMRLAERIASSDIQMIGVCTKLLWFSVTVALYSKSFMVSVQCFETSRI